MLKSRFLRAVVLVSLTWGPSQAMAVALPFSGTLEFQIGTLPAVSIARPGLAETTSRLDGFFSAVDLAANIFATEGLSVVVSLPSAAPVGGLHFTVANGPGHFARTFGGEGSFRDSVMPLDGHAKVCLFGTCSAALANITVPLSVVGRGGSAVVTAAVNLTVVGAPWTTSIRFAGSVYREGGETLGDPTHVLQLVTPVFVSTNLPALAVVPTFAILEMRFSVPEPGTLVLLASGFVVLVAFGRHRRSS